MRSVIHCIKVADLSKFYFKAINSSIGDQRSFEERCPEGCQELKKEKQITEGENTATNAKHHKQKTHRDVELTFKASYQK